MRPGRHPYRRNAAALISAVLILVVVAAFAAVFLSLHAAQLSTAETGVYRLRAQAATMAGTHLTLWRLRSDTDLQNAVARVVQENDTSFDVDPLFQVDGTLAGATFHVDLWPGPDTVRLKATATAGGAHVQRWAQMPIQLRRTENLLVGGDFENREALEQWPIWLGSSSLGHWLAGYGLTLVDDPRRQPLSVLSWNISCTGGNHFAESLRWSNICAQYVEGNGAKGTLDLALDYVRRNGNLSVQVRGVNSLPRLAILLPGLSGYEAWAEAGTLLYDSRNLPQASSWSHFTASFDAGAGYRYYVVQIEAQTGSSLGSAVERAVDNVNLSAR